MKVLWEGKLPVMICPRDTKPYRLVLRKVDNHLRVLGERWNDTTWLCCSPTMERWMMEHYIAMTELD